METDYFQRTKYLDGKLIIEEVKQLTFNVIPIFGNGYISAVGGNGRFKFNLGGVEFISTFTKNIATTKENSGFNREEDEYWDYSNVKLDRNIAEEWSKLYIYHEDTKSYWKSIIT